MRIFIEFQNASKFHNVNKKSAFFFERKITNMMEFNIIQIAVLIQWHLPGYLFLFISNQNVA